MAFTDIYPSLDLGPYTVYILGIVLIWELIWKGFGLWKSAKLNQPIWFIAMLVLNTVGILPILYIFVFSQINFDEEKLKKTKKKSKKRKKK